MANTDNIIHNTNNAQRLQQPDSTENRGRSLFHQTGGPPKAGNRAFTASQNQLRRAGRLLHFI
jgi:hypothetical protein